MIKSPIFKYMCLPMLLIFLINTLFADVSFALAPPLASNSPCEIVTGSDGKHSVKVNAGGRPGKFEREWELVDISYLAADALRLGISKSTLADLMKAHLAAVRSKLTGPDGYDIDGMIEHREGGDTKGKIYAFSIPTRRNGKATSYLTYSLKKPEFYDFTITSPKAPELRVYVTASNSYREQIKKVEWSNKAEAMTPLGAADEELRGELAYKMREWLKRFGGICRRTTAEREIDVGINLEEDWAISIKDKDILLGQFKVRLCRGPNGRLALLFTAIRSSPHYDSLCAGKSNPYLYWQEKTILRLAYWADCNGVDMFVASGEFAKAGYPQPSGRDLAENYRLKGISNSWEKAILDLKDSPLPGGPFLWYCHRHNKQSGLMRPGRPIVCNKISMDPASAVYLEIHNYDSDGKLAEYAASSGINIAHTVVLNENDDPKAAASKVVPVLTEIEYPNIIIGGNYYHGCIADAFSSVSSRLFHDGKKAAYHFIGDQINFGLSNDYFATWNENNIADKCAEYRKLKSEKLLEKGVEIFLNGNRLFSNVEDDSAPIRLYYWCTTKDFVDSVETKSAGAEAISTMHYDDLKRCLAISLTTAAFGAAILFMHPPELAFMAVLSLTAGALSAGAIFFSAIVAWKKLTKGGDGLREKAWLAANKTGSRFNIYNLLNGIWPELRVIEYPSIVRKSSARDRTAIKNASWLHEYAHFYTKNDNIANGFNVVALTFVFASVSFAVQLACGFFYPDIVLYMGFLAAVAPVTALPPRDEIIARGRTNIDERWRINIPASLVWKGLSKEKCVMMLRGSVDMPATGRIRIYTDSAYSGVHGAIRERYRKWCENDSTAIGKMNIVFNDITRTLEGRDSEDMRFQVPGELQERLKGLGVREDTELEVAHMLGSHGDYIELVPVSPAGAVARGDPEELVRGLKDLKDLRDSIDFRGVVNGIVGDIEKSVPAGEYRKHMIKHLKYVLAGYESKNFSVKESDSVILEDKADVKRARGWMHGFNTIPSERDMPNIATETDKESDTLRGLLTHKAPNTLCLSTQVLDDIICEPDTKSAASLLKEYVFHEIFCPVYTHHETRYRQEIIYKDNYPAMAKHNGKIDGDLTEIFKKIIADYRPRGRIVKSVFKDPSQAAHVQELIASLASDDAEIRYDAAKELGQLIESGVFRNVQLKEWARNHGVLIEANKLLSPGNDYNKSELKLDSTKKDYSQFLLKGPEIMRSAIRSYCDHKGLPRPEDIDTAKAMRLRELLQNYVIADACGSLLGDVSLYRYNNGENFQPNLISVWPRLEYPEFKDMVPLLAKWFVSEKSSGLPKKYFNLGMGTEEILKDNAKPGERMSMAIKCRQERLVTLSEVIDGIKDNPPPSRIKPKRDSVITYAPPKPDKDKPKPVLEQRRLDLGKPAVTTPESEEAILMKIEDTIRCIEDKVDLNKEPVVLAIGIGWIKGYDKEGDLERYTILNQLIIDIRGYCEKRGIKMINGREDALPAMIEEERKGSGRVIAIVENQSIESYFKDYLKDNMATLIGVNSSGLLADGSYPRIVELIRASLALAYKDQIGLADVMSNNLTIHKITPPEGRAYYIVVPRAEEMDNNKLKSIRSRVEKFA